MPTSQRKFEPALIDQVFNDPYRFEFFQAVRLIEAWLIDQNENEADVVNKFIRFDNSLALHFPACEIEAVEIHNREQFDCETLDSKLFKDGSSPILRITPTLFGLLGVSGTLPVHYTERIAMHLAVERSDGPRAFLDTFSSRAVALFFESWRKYKPEFKRRTSKSRGFLHQLLSIAGSTEGYDSSPVGDSRVQSDTLAYFAAAIQHKPVSCAYMNSVLQEYFEVPIKITPFIGAWYALPRHQQSALGGAHAALGVSAVAGTRVWQRDLRQRIEIGPLDEAAFASFLPCGKSARALRQMLETFTGLSIEYEVKLTLHSAAVRPIVLDASSFSGKLGQSAFLKTVHDSSDRSDVLYEILAF